MKNLRIFAAIAALAGITFAGAILAVRADAPLTAQTITFPGATGTTISGYLVTPEKSGRYPALVVIHEWWGLTDWVKEQARKLGDLGYIALAVDLYRGKVTSDPEEAHELMRGLPQDRAVSDLKAAFAYLATRNDVDRGHIGSLGWCMGGGLSLQLAIHEPRLAACVVNYGALPPDPNDIQQIFAPVLGNFGEEDRGITPQDVNQSQAQPNPGDQYINPVTVYTQNPLSPEQAAYNLDTTGANRIQYAANNFLNLFSGLAQFINQGGFK